ncbi:MAG: mechanosensitive ion channel domain-containing protein [Bacteroidales bacterium]|jgi:miniconductance mechanosensitive channel
MIFREGLNYIQDQSYKLLQELGFSAESSEILVQTLAYLGLGLIAYLLYRVSVIVVRAIVVPLIGRSKNRFDDLLMQNKFFKKLSFLVPALWIYYVVNDPFFTFTETSAFFRGVTTVFFYVIAVLIVDSVLSTINDYYNRYSFAKEHPIAGPIQVIKILSYLLGLLGVIGYLLNKDLSAVLLGLGTISAVLMLIFKDPILGFAGGLQLTFNKMVRIGDWITMSKFGADGTVIEINLTTVKVQNFDKTIITIPTYSMVTDSFQNWRGMEESGGRRIKRSINIDMNTVQFCTPEMLERFKKIKFVSEYIQNREIEIEAYNQRLGIDPSIKVNGRRQTNLGVFQAYLKAYLHNRPDINDDMTFIVRQLQSTEKGIPIEIYVFTTTTEWVAYEEIQVSIFDHILAAIPEFELRVFQYPGSYNSRLFVPPEV